MLGVRRKLLNQGVVELVGVVAEGPLAFQDDHGRAVAVELTEYQADAFHRLQ
jgi:hypothetical protein